MNVLSNGIKRILLCVFVLCSLVFVTNISAVYAAPQIKSEGAVLIDADTGALIYGKNENIKYYPASTTKILTALLVAENTGMQGNVLFSQNAVSNLESGAVTLGLKAGDVVSVKDCMYGLLLRSANEVANGLAEHVGGSISNFSAMMNERAKQLGAKNSNFVNPNGLNNANHYTTAYDLAMIARAVYKRPEIVDIMKTLTYTFPATSTVPERIISMGHKMIYKNDYRYYNGVVGGKTGYTSKAGNTLVTMAQRDGRSLIAVILKGKQTHYEDTKALFDYGFSLSVNDYKKLQLNAPKLLNNVNLQNNSLITSNTSVNVNNGTNLGVGPDSGANNAALNAPLSAPSEQPIVSDKAIRLSDRNNSNSAGPAINISTVADSGTDAGLNLNQGPSQVKLGWHSDKEEWFYIKENGERAKDEVLKINNRLYWFDSNGIMATGWRKDQNNEWYYMSTSGGMLISSWVKDKEYWYYLGGEGKMLKNTTTPDGYKVNNDGVWIN